MPGLVIQEIYANSGASPASSYDTDYVVIHNTGSNAIDLSGYALQFINGTGTGTWAVASLTGTIPAYGFYLVKMGTTTAGGTSLPAADFTASASSFNMGGNNGKLAITDTTTALSGGAPASPAIVDLVGYGSSATTFEGSKATSGNALQSIHRDSAGGWDTNNNGTDFTLTTPNPRNTSSATVNAAPELILDSTTVNLGEGETVVLLANQVTATDAEGETEGSGLTYSIVTDGAAPDGAFFSVSSTGALSFVTAPDYENPLGSGGNTYVVKVRVTDPGNQTAEQIVTVNVTPVSEVFVDLDNALPSIAENTSTASAIKVADILLTGVGAGTATLTLTGADAALFEISGNALYIKAGSAIDFEQNPVLDVTVNAFDAGSTTAGDTAIFSLNVTDVTPETITGTPGDDIMIGGTGTDTFTGLAGNDLLDGGAGDDALTGGLGNDTYYVDSAKDKVVELKNEGTDTIVTSIDILSLVANVENVVMTGAARRLVGNALNNTITGSNGNELINGWSGNDIIEGGSGDDSLYGYSGIDTASYENATSGVTVSLALKVQQDTIGAGKDLLLAFENLTGSAHDDILTGNTGANILSGGAGNDFLFGDAGNDTLIGGAGNDYLDGGAGTADIASFATETANLTITLSSAPVSTVTTVAGTDTLIGIEGLAGGSGNDTLTGNAGNNTIDGGAGDDSIEGGAGTDTLIGGANGASGDTVSYANATAGVKVNLALTTSQNTVGAGSDKLSGFENIRGSNFDDTLTGSAGDNTINGSEGSDKIYGGAGNDNLRGGQGADTLDGGAGNDLLNGGQSADTFLFKFALGASNVDTIQDFKVSDGDKIALENAIFTKVGAAGALNAAAFHVGTAADDALHRIIYDSGTGKLYYDADGSGAGAQVQFAVLTGNPALSNTDILIV